MLRVSCQYCFILERSHDFQNQVDARVLEIGLSLRRKLTLPRKPICTQPNGFLIITHLQSQGRNGRRKKKLKQKCCHMGQSNSGKIKTKDYRLACTQLPRALDMYLGIARLIYPPMLRKRFYGTIGHSSPIRLSLQMTLNRTGGGRG